MNMNIYFSIVSKCRDSAGEETNTEKGVDIVGKN
jgi:hypothetical protein